MDTVAIDVGLGCAAAVLYVDAVQVGGMVVDDVVEVDGEGQAGAAAVGDVHAAEE